MLALNVSSLEDRIQQNASNIFEPPSPRRKFPKQRDFESTPKELHKCLQPQKSNGRSEICSTQKHRTKKEKHAKQLYIVYYQKKTIIIV